MLTYLNPGDRNLHRFSDKPSGCGLRSDLMTVWSVSGSLEHQGKSQDAVAVCRERESWRDAEVELGLPCICPFHRFIRRRQVLCRGLSQSQWMEMSRHVLSISGRCFMLLFFFNQEKPLWGCMSASSRRRDDQAFSPLTPFNDIIFHMHFMHSYSCINIKPLKANSII